MPAHRTRSGRSPLWWVAVPLCLAYAIGVFAFFSLRFLLPAWPPALMLLGYLGPFLYLPLAWLLPLACISRARVAIAAAVAVLLLFLAIYLPFFLPRFGAVPAFTGSPIAAMTFNLGPGVSRPDGLVAAIAAEGADVVALQELYPAAAQAFDEALTERYPYRILPAEPGATGLLSRYPILAHQTFRPAGVGRPALHATLERGGEELQVFVLHPEPPVSAAGVPGGRVRPELFDQRLEAQMADVAARARAVPGPVLVMGDLNMSDQSRAYVTLRQSLRDAFWEAGTGLGFTFPANRRVGKLAIPGPLVRIDYIWFNDVLYPLQASVGCQGGSDHCYVLARLAPVARARFGSAAAWQIAPHQPGRGP